MRIHLRGIPLLDCRNRPKKRKRIKVTNALRYPRGGFTYIFLATSDGFGFAANVPFPCQRAIPGSQAAKLPHAKALANVAGEGFPLCLPGIQTRRHSQVPRIADQIRPYHELKEHRFISICSL